jgi:hypothetical protein
MFLLNQMKSREGFHQAAQRRQLKKRKLCPACLETFLDAALVAPHRTVQRRGNPSSWQRRALVVFACPGSCCDARQLCRFLSRVFPLFLLGGQTHVNDGLRVDGKTATVRRIGVQRGEKFVAHMPRKKS